MQYVSQHALRQNVHYLSLLVDYVLEHILQAGLVGFGVSSLSYESWSSKI